MIINESKIYYLNEFNTTNLSDGSSIWKSGDKFYIRKGDTKKEISEDQYNKLMGTTDDLNEIPLEDADEETQERVSKENEEAMKSIMDLDQDDPDYDENLKDTVQEQSKKKSFKDMINRMMEEAKAKSEDDDWDEDEWVDKVCDFIKDSFDWIETYLLGDIF